MPNSPPDFDALLLAGIAAMERGDRATAQELLLQVIEHDERNALAWWWLSLAVTDRADQITAVENVLALDPYYPEAQARREELRAAPQPKADVWKSLLPEAPQEEPDGDLDNPFQCPYCGRVTDTDARQCYACGRNLWRRVQKSTDSGLFRLMQLLLFLLLALDIVNAFAPAFALGTTGSADLGIIYNHPLAQWVLGNFATLTVPEANWLLSIFEGRAAALLGILIGLSLHWAIVYYLAFPLLFADVAWNLYLLFMGYLGLGALVTNLALGAAVISLLVACGDEFPINDERLLVKPSTTVRRASDYYALGFKYKQQGMWAMAVAQWRKSVGLAPNVTQYYKDLGVAYAQTDHFSRSLRVLKEAQHQTPNDASIAEIVALVEKRQAAYQQKQLAAARKSKQ